MGTCTEISKLSLASYKSGVQSAKRDPAPLASAQQQFIRSLDLHVTATEAKLDLYGHGANIGRVSKVEPYFSLKHVYSRDALLWLIDSMYASLSHPYKINPRAGPMPCISVMRYCLLELIPSPLVLGKSIERKELPYWLRNSAFLLYILLQRLTGNDRSCVVQRFNKIYNPKYQERNCAS
jgi:hypothetical protein